MSLIGVQSQSGTIQQLNRVLEKKPLAYLLLGNAVNFGIAQYIRERSPSTLILLRAQADNWSLDAGVVNFAYRSMTTAGPFQSAGLCDFLLPPNEPIVWNDVDARRLNAQMVQCAELYRSSGYATGAYNFSVGNPDYPLWPYLNEGILASDGWLFLHQYGAPNMQRDAENLSLRHRKARTFMSQAVRNVLKIGVTECFIDLGIGNRPPDGEADKGGYRNLRNPIDDDSWWIRNLTQQLDWYDAELARDPYVKFVTGFGYGMQEPWVGLGFDIANIDTDRAYFINWLKVGSTPIPPPIPEPPIPEPPTPHPEPSMTIEQERIKAATNSIGHGLDANGIVYVPTFAFPQFAASLRLGPPLGEEYRYTRSDNVRRAGQAWRDAIIECNEGDFANTFAFNWGDGKAYTPDTSSPPVIPHTCPPAIAANGAVCNLVEGAQFYVSGATVKQGVSAFCVVTVLGLSGSPLIGVRVVNIFKGSANGEVFETDGNGNARFQFGSSSASSVAGQGPFTFAISLDAFKTQDPPTLHIGTLISDLVQSVSDWQGEHTEWSIQFRQVK